MGEVGGGEGEDLVCVVCDASRSRTVEAVCTRARGGVSPCVCVCPCVEVCAGIATAPCGVGGKRVWTGTEGKEGVPCLRAKYQCCVLCHQNDACIIRWI